MLACLPSERMGTQFCPCSRAFFFFFLLCPICALLYNARSRHTHAGESGRDLSRKRAPNVGGPEKGKASLAPQRNPSFAFRPPLSLLPSQLYQQGLVCRCMRALKRRPSRREREEIVASSFYLQADTHQHPAADVSAAQAHTVHTHIRKSH